MRIELSVVAVGYDGLEMSYDYSLNLPDSTPLEQVEAHSKNMLRILEQQANESGPEDEDDRDTWPPSEKKAP